MTRPDPLDEERLPPRVSSALNIVCHEKIRRGDFCDDSDYESDVMAVARGERDTVKQGAVYSFPFCFAPPILVHDVSTTMPRSGLRK